MIGGFRSIFSLNFIRLLRGVITPSVTTLLRGENDSKQSDEFQANSFCVFVFQGSLLVIVIMIDGSEKRNCEGAF